MLTLVRVVLGLAGLVVVWILSYWAYFVHHDRSGAVFMGRGAPFLMGLAAAAIIVAATEHLQHGFLSAAILGGLLFGGICFVLGLFGPVISDPNGNQGWLLGLLTHGPGGLLLGGGLGALWWWARQRWKRA